MTRFVPSQSAGLTKRKTARPNERTETRRGWQVRSGRTAASRHRHRSAISVVITCSASKPGGSHPTAVHVPHRSRRSSRWVRAIWSAGQIARAVVVRNLDDDLGRGSGRCPADSFCIRVARIARIRACRGRGADGQTASGSGNCLWGSDWCRPTSRRLFRARGPRVTSKRSEASDSSGPQPRRSRHRDVPDVSCHSLSWISEAEVSTPEFRP